MFGCPLKAIRDEDFPASTALVNGGPAVDNSPPNSPGGEYEIERPPVTGVATTATLALGPSGDFGTPAPRALTSDDLNSLADPQIAVIAGPALPFGLLDDLARAYVNPAPLVVKMG